MTRIRGPLALTAAVALFLITACARPADGAGDSAAAPAEEPSAAADQPVLRVKQEGGFVPAEMIPGRIPSYSLYGDGRLITEGPQIMMYPGPALPNLQVRTLTPAQVAELVAQAKAAGVGSVTDYGQPGVADVPSTVVELRDGGRVVTASAEALREAMPDDPALTDAQRQARTKLATFVDTLSEQSGATSDYRPVALAALARPYVAPQDDLPVKAEPIAWPGPALPGERLAEHIELGCVTVTGADLDKVLAAAKAGNQNTAWTSGGKQYGLILRPLLPDETSCGSLKVQR